MPHTKEIESAIKSLCDECDFTLPTLMPWKDFLISVIEESESDLALLVKALSLFCQYLTTRDLVRPLSIQVPKIQRIIINANSHSNPIQYIEGIILISNNNINLSGEYNNLLSKSLRQHKNPLALAKAVIFGARMGLIFNDSPHAKSNYQKLVEVAERWFNRVEVENYFQRVSTHHFSQQEFDDLLLLNENMTEPKIYDFRIVCALSLLGSANPEAIKENLTQIEEFLSNECFSLAQINMVLNIPYLLTNSNYPMQLTTAIIKISNARPFLTYAGNTMAEKNCNQLIAVAKCWFDTIKLKQLFDDISTWEFTQALFDQLVMESNKKLPLEEIRLNVGQIIVNRKQGQTQKSPPIHDTCTSLPKASISQASVSFLYSIYPTNPRKQAPLPNKIQTTIQQQRRRSKTEEEKEISSQPSGWRKSV